MRAEAGWYVDWGNNRQQRYFNGFSWSTDTTERTAEARELPVNFDREAAARSLRKVTPSGDGLKSASAIVYIVAALAAIGAVAGGIALITHQVTDCSGYFCEHRNPFSSTGWALLVGGLLQSFVIAVVGHLCTVVSEQRAALNALGKD